MYIVVMEGLTFDWDPDKAHRNKSKHGVSFEEAETVFYDENARLIYDPDHSESEDRFLLLGLSARMRLVHKGESPYPVVQGMKRHGFGTTA